MVKSRIVLIALILSTLACGVSAPDWRNSPIPAPVPIRTVTEMSVTAERLYVRTQPEGDVSTYLLQGDNVSVYETLDGWCRITPRNNPPRWVWCGWLEGN